MKKIKKSFAVVAALLLMSSSMNVSGSNMNMAGGDPYKCFIAADHEATVQGFIQGWTYEEEYTAFLALYDACVGPQE